MANSEALESALKLLARKPAFEAEIRAHLASKGMAEQAEGVLDHLRRRRIIDDRKLIQNLIERRAGKRAVGNKQLRAELLRRGAPEEEVNLALAGLGESDESIDDLLRSKLKPGDSRAKAGRFLIGRGFDHEAVESALDRFFGSD